MPFHHDSFPGHRSEPRRQVYEAMAPLCQELVTFTSIPLYRVFPPKRKVTMGQTASDNATRQSCTGQGWESAATCAMAPHTPEPGEPAPMKEAHVQHNVHPITPDDRVTLGPEARAGKLCYMRSGSAHQQLTSPRTPRQQTKRTAEAASNETATDLQTVQRKGRESAATCGSSRSVHTKTR